MGLLVGSNPDNCSSTSNRLPAHQTVPEGKTHLPMPVLHVADGITIRAVKKTIRTPKPQAHDLALPKV
jgi:hypothetical protein